MKKTRRFQSGFSLVEMLIAMTIALGLLAVASGLFARALGTRSRESRRTDALTSAQAALNVMSREIGNSGFGLTDSTGSIHQNGIVITDSSQSRLRVRANVINTNVTLDDLGEDVTYYYDATTKSVVRHDPQQSPKTSYVINRVSDVKFKYFDYTGSSSNPVPADGSNTPTANTGRVRITVTVELDPVQGQPSSQTVTLTSDVTLRNSNYMLNQY